ncbi:putative late blight resistance protein homolog R1A-3 [Olea europaea var. sylvestris]|uniref:putative late blight resistance protein homolog R1A-3 n=1 Tax=Olea europaea var. sylvestris TaxID=158386 RepID=UPI000C1D01D9|nr:putative late blight resistance protein homolog R1A-3 [Olea europaea var. sylvestris]
MFIPKRNKHEMAPSTNNLRKLLENQFKNGRLEMFDGQGQLVLIVAQFMIKMCDEDDEEIGLLKYLDDLARNCLGSSQRSEAYRNFPEDFWQFMTGLRSFFIVNSKRSPIYYIGRVAVFIDLFLEILEEILRLQPNFILRVEGSIKTLKMELKFLITFLGDVPSLHTDIYTTYSVLTDIESVANSVGYFLYTFFFNRDPISVTDMDQSLSHLLESLRLVTEKIIAHCNTIPPKLPSRRTRNTEVVSLFLVDSSLDDLENVINHEDDRIVSVKAQIQKIHGQLMFLRLMLATMGEKRFSELEEFFVRIRDIAYEVKYVVSSFSPVQYLTIRLPQVIVKTEIVRKQLEEEMNKYDAGMLKDEEYARQQMLLQTQTPDTRDIVGLGDEVDKIKEQLLRDTKQLQFISISGMPGLGKTTLAKKLYDDPSIVQHFDKRAWCVVSQNYQIRNILIDILTSMDVVNEEARMVEDEGTLGEALHKCLLTSGRFILFIDDMWNVEAWNKIQTYIPDCRKGNRILFTARDEDFASKASYSSKASLMENNALKRLTDEGCWDLLQRKVFQQNSCPKNLIFAGKEIAIKCDGLPLAVVVIAAVLANMEKESKLWEDVAKRISSQITEESNKYMNILELSYKYLPMHLKPCFLYFGTFEEDREIAVRKLISLWIAEGFIGKEEKEIMETEAQKYLEHLINRSLIQVVRRRSNGRVKTCRIHDLLHDMCLRIAKKYNFIKVIQNQLSVYEQCQRLSIHSHSIPSFSRPVRLHVCSLLGHLPDPSTFIFGNMKLLKVLDLSSMDFRFYNSTQAEDLFLLRFLAVSSIPSSVERFENLEFLFVNNRKVVEIPENLFNMVKLRNVYFSSGAQFSKSWRKRAAEGERFLTSGLQRVSYVSIHDENDEKILRYSPNLRRLKCRFAIFFDSSENNYRYPILNFLGQLESLSISFRSSYVTDDPNLNLTNLPLNLRRLTLSNFNSSSKQIEIIGKLPELEVLKLRNGTSEEKRWDINEGEFEKLKFLELDEVQIEKWNASNNQFPNLERLVLRNCQLLEIPSDLEHCPTLRKIELRGCKKSVEGSAWKIKEVQNDYNNDVEVNIYRS